MADEEGEMRAAAAPLIELGWLLAGPLEAEERRATAAAREGLAEALAREFPEFRWEMPWVELADPVRDADEPAAQLHRAAQERDHRGWDFAFLVTPHELRSYTRSFALAVPSRALAVAVMSLARLAPDAGARGETLARRIGGLALHLFGDLNGLWHRSDSDAVMAPPASVEDLDAARVYLDDDRQALRAALHEVADLRLEERGVARRPLGFYLRGAFERSGEIASAVLQARPWELPLRLGRLTAAALSALFVLLITAEAWDLGTRQSALDLALLSLAVLAGTTAFVLTRQKLLLSHVSGRATERVVVTNVSATLVVLLGLATTWALLFVLTLALAQLLFSAELVGRWAPDLEAPGALAPRLSMAATSAALGLLIGALGASLEGQHYFRHVIYADEET